MRIWCGMRSLFKPACMLAGGSRKTFITAVVSCFLAAAVAACPLRAKAETHRYIKHGDGIMRMVAVDSPFPAVYMFEMPPSWAPEDVPADAAAGSWYGRHINDAAWIRIIPFDNSGGLKAEEIAKLIKKQYFNDGECSLDDFHKEPGYVSSTLYPYEAYFYEKCPPGKVNLFVICEVEAPYSVIFNLACRGEKRQDLDAYLDGLDRIMRRFQWEAK